MHRLLITMILLTAAANAADSVRVVAIPPTDSASPHYVGNRAPLQPSPLLKLPNGAIEPRGWLRHQLELEAAGMCGHLDEVSPFLKYEGNGWVDPNGKTGWEELGYWLKGYGDLGYVLRDQRIIKNTQKWIDGILAAQQADGWFGPNPLRLALKGKPDMWPHMPVLNALQSNYEFTNDPRILTFMSRYFKWQNALPPEYFSGSWQHTRFGDNIESIFWLYNRTGEAWLLELPPKMHAHSAKWSEGIADWHNVNFTQGFREPAELWQLAKEPKLLAASENDYEKMMELYGQFPGGGFCGDENCRRGYTDPRGGIETCGIVEFMHSFEMLAKISGNPLWLDRCEGIAFNLLPASMTPDLKALHYINSANVTQLDKNNKHPGIANSGTMISYSPYEVYRCCQHNHGMGWPYYAEHLVLATPDKGLCVVLYSASLTTAKVADGTSVKLEQTTDYPFSEYVDLKLSTEKPVQFPLYLRVPQWSKSAEIKINGQPQTVDAQPLHYIAIDRTWNDGDKIALKFPMQIVVKTWAKNKNAVSVDYGPLSFALAIPYNSVRYGGKPDWPESELYPTAPWNYGLVIDAANPAASFKVSRRDGKLEDQPFTAETAPIQLHATGRKIKAWTMDNLNMVGKLQPSPVKSDEPDEPLTLVPMGAARLRIACFPTIATGADGHDWGGVPAIRAMASHCFGGDSVDALHSDAAEPRSSHDESIERFTWWDHKGSTEWVQYDFPAAKEISSVEVYWFDDTGHGACRVPESWKVLYKDGDAWKEVDSPSGYGVKLDQYNAVHFKPQSTIALRLEVKLKPNVSGGILRWKFK
ncbi:MAG TPA: beta-L-arabinofuranosidase domain-containing protein [Planctomycetota bacterium]|nr:beta-L-arabinofuranosidase domain-containing protein [Planctomycetota bacterium]